MGSTGIRVSGVVVVVAAMVVLMAFSEVRAQAPAPAPDCLTKLLNLSDCLTFVEAGSNLTKPEKNCCPSLAGLVESSPECLCQLLGNANSFGIPVDVSKALKLPSACGVSTPDPSLCSVFGVPISSPTASEGPTASAPGVPTGIHRPSKAPTATVPRAPTISPITSDGANATVAPSLEEGSSLTKDSSGSPSILGDFTLVSLVVLSSVATFLFF
ncbi:PREDICTED: non-specific lipid transfer protein GPI-anchored 2-like isoform X1 [Nelumbo nucifera]|uniref:Non-specific lipid transfer protein GPI-anchored 2-like isoform X1 n=1 Tax=Nelumbo nucifera TaxID=4432 RepID=A0A1U7ZJ75_NELNU|nr:PREDICTED: non-specific lipid transfer protein GPI-anchored 2-like isoform X1 [Nelumbo nucifera]